KQTIIAVVQELSDKYGVTRDNISLIWGGGQTELTEKQKAKAEFKKKRERLVELGVDVDELEESLDLDSIPDRELIQLPEHLKLGQQSLEERQREIDKFQRGDSLYCLFTMKSG